MCRVLLVTEGTDEDDPSVFGQEAHIISAAPSGPRAGDLPDFDAYDNLILLCGKDHKRVDDQVHHYTPELLRQVKRDHESRVASLDETRPSRLVADPTHPVPKKLRLCMTGSALWNLMSGVYSFYPSWPEGLSEKQQDMIASFLDDLRDWMDLTSFNDSYQAGRDAARHLNEHVKALTETGLLIGARQRHCLLTGGAQEPSPWRVLEIEIQPLRIAQLVDEEGSPVWPPADATSSG